VPGDIKEVFEIDEVSQTKLNKAEKLVEKIKHYNFAMENLEKVLGSVEVEGTSWCPSSVASQHREDQQQTQALALKLQ
jgi:hypothetical protein